MPRIGKVLSAAFILSGFFGASTLLGQRAGSMTIGVMGGANFATLEQDPDPTEVEYGYKAGVVAGGFLNYALSNGVSIEPQVLFSQKGADVDGTGANSALDGSIRINYIAVPVLLRFAFAMPNSSVRPFVFVGPEIAFKVGCTARGEILAVTGSRDCDETDVLADIKSTDVGAAAGGGIEFNAGTYVMRLDARYTLGLTNINDAPDEREIKNRAFSVTIGLGIPWPRY